MMYFQYYQAQIQISQNDLQSDLPLKTTLDNITTLSSGIIDPTGMESSTAEDGASVSSEIKNQCSYTASYIGK